MTLQDFVQKYQGKGIDVDGAYGNQCVDLIKAYYKEVVGIPAQTGNAVDYWKKFPAASFEQIANSPEGVPQAGDIVVWGTKVGPYGHIAIALDGSTTRKLVTFDQNWPVGSKCQQVSHSYAGVLGWLRPTKPVPAGTKAADPAPVPVEIKTDPSVALQAEIARLTETNRGLSSGIEVVTAERNDLKAKVTELTGKLADQEGKWKADVATAYDNGFKAGAASLPAPKIESGSILARIIDFFTKRIDK